MSGQSEAGNGVVIAMDQNGTYYRVTDWTHLERSIISPQSYERIDESELPERFEPFYKLEGDGNE